VTPEPCAEQLKRIVPEKQWTNKLQANQRSSLLRATKVPSESTELSFTMNCWQFDVRAVPSPVGLQLFVGRRADGWSLNKSRDKKCVGGTTVTSCASSGAQHGPAKDPHVDTGVADENTLLPAAR
jgi:hypothetical protein